VEGRCCHATGHAQGHGVFVKQEGPGPGVQESASDPSRDQERKEKRRMMQHLPSPISLSPSPVPPLTLFLSPLFLSSSSPHLAQTPPFPVSVSRLLRRTAPLTAVLGGGARRSARRG